LGVVESLVRHTQRLAALIEGEAVSHLAEWRAAEDALYTDPDDPLTSRDLEGLSVQLTAAGWTVQGAHLVETTHTLHINEAVVERWFSPRVDSYASRLKAFLEDAQQIDVFHQVVRRCLMNRSISWRSVSGLLIARR